MARHGRSPDAREQLELLLREEPTHRELSAFLAKHQEALARALGISWEQLRGLQPLDHHERLVALTELAKQARKARRDAHREQRTNLAVAAGTMLSHLARWQDQTIELSRDIILGQSLVPPWARYVRFDPQGRRPVLVLASTLRAAGRALRKRRDVRAYLDGEALVLEWNGGRGRLRLFFSRSTPREDEHVFHTVLDTPRPARRTRGAWLGDVLSDLGFAL
jgi:hypothetical protein